MTCSRLRDRRGGCRFWRIWEIPIHQKRLGPLAQIQIFETESFLSVGISPTDKKNHSPRPLRLCGEELVFNTSMECDRMFGLGALGKMLILVGVFIILIGILLLIGEKIPWVGRLPGDIIIRKKNFTFYFPIVTSILISIILTLLFALFRK
jgi:hypothetical protein